MTEDLQAYIEAHTSPEPEPLAALRRGINLRCLYPRMCSGHVQGRLLTLLTAMAAPRRALEIGTYAGYSALCIAEGLPEGSTLDTVEIDDEMEPRLRRLFSTSPLGSKITLHIADAEQLLPSYPPETFDLVFLDADKRRYLETFRAVLPLVAPGGFILADNTLWDGKVADPDAKPDPQTAGIRRFNDAVAADPSLLTVILPLRDGLTLIQKKENMIKALLFDLGGVIMDIRRERCVEAFRQIGMEKPEDFLGDFSQKGPFLRLEEGAITPDCFRDEIRRLIPVPVTDVQIDGALMRFLIGIPAERLRQLEELHSRYPVYMLSNTNEIMWNGFIVKEFDKDGHNLPYYFDGCVTSFDVKCCKPAPGIFLEAVRRFGLNPAETLFLDDSAANCRAAEALGFQTAHVTQGQSLIDLVREAEAAR